MNFKEQGTQTMNPQKSSTTTYKPLKSLKFGEKTGFQAELTRRVEELFQNTDLQKRDCPEMYLKTVIILLSFSAAYVFLVFFAQKWWEALLLSIATGLSAVAIFFNIMHDGSHNSYSKLPWVNKLMAITVELIGFSSYYWKYGHTVLHHQYVNITGYDHDFDFGDLARITPFQRWFPHHRWQHYYIWLLYGYYAIEWALVNDFSNLLDGKFYNLNYPRPKGVNLAIFLIGKAVFLTLVFGIPLMFHSVKNVLICYGIFGFTVGIVFNCVFILAHEVEEAVFPAPPSEETGIVKNEWAIHQIETTVNLSCNNKFLSWFLGGLDFQIEHHLFPHICHVNYPKIAPIVEKTCQEYGIKYQKHKSIWASLSSHFRLLRRLGMSKVYS